MRSGGHFWTWCCMSWRVWMCRWMWHKLMISSFKIEGVAVFDLQDQVSKVFTNFFIIYLQTKYLVIFAWLSIIIHLPYCICSTYSVIAAKPFTIIDVKGWSWMR